MKLRGSDVVATQDRTKLDAMQTRCQRWRVRRRVIRVRVIEIEVGRGAAGELAEALVKLHRVPADVRDAHAFERVRQRHDLAAHPVQAPLQTVLFAALGQQLHADADPEQGLASNEGPLLYRVEQTTGPQLLGAEAERTDAGQQQMRAAIELAGRTHADRARPEI